MCGGIRGGASLNKKHDQNGRVMHVSGYCDGK